MTRQGDEGKGKDDVYCTNTGHNSVIAKASLKTASRQHRHSFGKRYLFSERILSQSL